MHSQIFALKLFPFIKEKRNGMGLFWQGLWWWLCIAVSSRVCCALHHKNVLCIIFKFLFLCLLGLCVWDAAALESCLQALALICFSHLHGRLNNIWQLSLQRVHKWLTGNSHHTETLRISIYLSKMQSCLSVFFRSFPNNYWDKFVKRKVKLIFKKIHEVKIKF